ncbi:MAG TPA: TatD family hydrolase [Candidatus Pacearchaeota archaeon]|nr:TatD family hydrolase [Candidatus Pacearchaeota archaeon]HRR94643.1 TatD family hydrolase [Candidatus Paceibacterota bacterium]HPC30349.1 TatD family hydrolase [Candidatus Pacearchaeota archaeon]HQG09039.1 TatD family hydrolase [Candidatus Pacearchaeota archaeon]HQH20020.1 TatD family hydrolase [Candidatus Pacearchaeota archaeon]
MFDTHAHLNFSDFDEDREEIITECGKNNIKIINPGTDLTTSISAVELARQYNNVYAGIGMHPTEINNLDFQPEDYKKLFCSKVVAIGEIGLDFWRLPKQEDDRNNEIKKQEIIFNQQLDLASEFNLPIIVHCRAAFDSVFKILQIKQCQGVLHCFSGNWKEAQKFLDLGFYLGIDGIIFKLNLIDVIKNCPLNKILLETDCPFLSPPNFSKRNTPLSLPIIAKEVAKIKNISVKEVEEITDRNAKTLFNI